MDYVEFRRDIVRFSKDAECVLTILRIEDETRYDFRADETGMHSSLWHNPLNEGFISWKEVEELIEKGKWENYPMGKRTVMKINEIEYVIEVYFLVDIN